MKDKILQYFYNNHDNQSHIIAKKFNMTVLQVDRIIDADLSQKANYYKDIEIKIKPIKVRVYDEMNDLIGEFMTMKEASIHFGFHQATLSKMTYGYDKRTIYHSKLNRTLTYIKL